MKKIKNKTKKKQKQTIAMRRVCSEWNENQRNKERMNEHVFAMYLSV